MATRRMHLYYEDSWRSGRDIWIEKVDFENLPDYGDPESPQQVEMTLDPFNFQVYQVTIDATYRVEKLKVFKTKNEAEAYCVLQYFLNQMKEADEDEDYTPTPIEIDGIKKTFKDVQIPDDVEFALTPSEYDSVRYLIIFTDRIVSTHVIDDTFGDY